jgi:hypothetical protein
MLWGAFLRNKNGDPQAAVRDVSGPSMCEGQPSSCEVIQGMETSAMAAATR